MRRVLPLVVFASFAVLAAAPSGLRAQGAPPSAQGSVVNNENGSGNCGPDVVTGTFNGPPVSSTACASTSGTYAGQPFTAGATATVTGGAAGNVVAHAEVNTADAVAPTLVADGNGMYFRYFSFFGPQAANLTKIVFTSAVSTSRFTSEAHGVPNVDATIAFGTLNPDNTMDVGSLFTSQGGELNCGNHPNVACDPSFSATIAISDLDPGVTNFFYQVFGQATATVSTLDPMVTADLSVDDPVPEFFFNNGQSSFGQMANNPNTCTGPICFNYNPPGTNPTVTPEPATFVLMATGMLGIGGFVRRKRRSSNAA